MSNVARWRSLFAGALAAISALASGAAAQTPSDVVVSGLDIYFLEPNTPDAFRALTGAGDPEVPRTDRDAFWFNLKDRPDGPLYKLLFPVTDQSEFYPGECRPDYALETLKARRAALGADHPYVRQWLAAQQAVFAACRDGAKAQPAASLPPALPTEDKTLAKLQAEDRAYQAASMAFYRGDVTGALGAFGKIAHSASPHRPAAVYMVASIRAGSRTVWGGGKPLIPPAQSITEVQAMIADPTLASVQQEARDLLGWIAYNASDDASRQVQVRAVLADLEAPAATLAKDPAARRRYGLARSDIGFLHTYPGEPGWWLGPGPPAEFTASRAMMQAARTDPMAAWVLFPPSYLQGHAWAPFATRPAGWSQLEDYAKAAASADSPLGFAWARVQHSISRSYDPALWSVVNDEATRAGVGDQRAIAALSFDFYHQVRLALSEQRGSARDDAQPLAAAIAEMKAFPFKASQTYAAARHDGLQYLMTVGRIADARRWRDQTAPTDQAAGLRDNSALLQVLAEDQVHFVSALSGDSADTLALQNNLSIAALRSLAASMQTPPVLRAKFARTAWARTYALGRPVDADLDRLMRELNPAVAGGWTSKPGRVVGPQDRPALLDVLRSPGLNILIVDTDRDPPTGPPTPADASPGLSGIDLLNHDDDNWWCAWKRGRNRRDLQAFLKQTFFGGTDLSQVDGENAFDLRDKLEAVLAQSFAFKNQDPAETAALLRTPCAPKMLTERVLDWVEHPRLFETRDGQAEALALAVRTTRYGCYSDGPHGAYSKAAWSLLHQRFPATPWAIKTKYWFNCPFGDKDCPAQEDD